MVKPRENRVPIMLSNEELEAIDNWRYANRIATRSDAIRRLCQLGLTLDSRLPDLFRRNVKAGASLVDLGRASGLITSDGEILDHPQTEVQEAVATSVASISDLTSSVKELWDYGSYARTPGKMSALFEDLAVTKEIFDRMLGRTNEDDGVIGRDDVISSESFYRVTQGKDRS